MYRFGSFEADSKTGELRKHGVKLKLQELPFRLLVSLLERPGDVVTREELQAKLWPDGTFVDFERGLGTALNKVRETLCDSAAAPRFVETIPRRGYRFIAEVERIEAQRVELENVATSDSDTSAPPARPTRKYAMAAFIMGIVAIVLAGGAAYSRFRTRPRPLTDQDVLVLADFTNTTGDAAFDGALRQALAFELEKSPFLKVMADQDVNQTVQLMGRPAGQRITNDIAHEVCVREGEKATIGGSIANLGKTYQIALQAINCQTGATLAREQALVDDKEHVLEAVAKTAMGMRAKLGESLSSIQKPDRHSAFEVTTNSLEALKAYQLGWELMAQDSSRESIGQFLHATELDPNFASAYMFLEIAYRNTGQPVRANEALTKAFALIDRIGDRERVYISGRYYQNITHEMNKAIDAYQLVERTYPRFAPPHNTLSVVYGNRGEYEKALAEEQEAFRLEPRNVLFMGNLMRVYIALDRFEEAKAITVKKMMAQKQDQPGSHLDLLNIAYIQDDQTAQEKEIEWFAGKPKEFQSLNVRAFNSLVHGQRRKAEELYQQAAAKARQAGDLDARAPDPGWIDVRVGDCEAARKEKSDALLELCGDPSALRLAEEQTAKNPPQNPDLGPLVYQRGLARLREGKGQEATAEFQKILDHKGRNWGPLYSLSFLGLARASALVGDTAKAKRAYQDFFTLWKDADKDLPPLRQANKELAALR
jgi:DNA-binding winged helix-turn-helix (wHTH) protein/tetratricopeptide (TPR) repeat protein